ncbi:MAG: ATP-binding cassette domain-containing protein [Actinobacteria bacterium]|nr:ATP-binding cassette domain-containing protein [Actinomycetota bacterium]
MSISLQGTIGRGEFERALNFSVADGEVLAITGPNGSGKSTIIHTIAGLISLRSGQLQSDNITWDEPSTRIWVAPENRTCAVVFQDLRLFPHMNVIANVSYGLRAHGVAKDEAMTRSSVALTRVGLSSFEKRRPNDLSGGERQRVALARALVVEPRVLLLDEPLSAVDASSRAAIRDLLPEVLSSFAGATILVTHDLGDVEAMATRSLGL